MESDIKRLSLAEIREMKSQGKIVVIEDAPEGPALEGDFWDNAKITVFEEKVSVHLKLDADVFAWFKGGGKGHLTRMQAVLKTYVEAMKRREA